MKATKKNDAEKSMVDRIRAFQRTSPANKRCADCTELGPTYICLDFQTFICQYCSGIHREFGHKIKSISLSQWTIHELEDLQKGGNDTNNACWLARWSKEDSEPNSADPQTVRDFLRQKYKDKKWWRAEKVPKAEKPKPSTESVTESSSVKVPSPTAEKQKQMMPVEDLLGDVAEVVLAPPAPPASLLELSSPAPPVTQTSTALAITDSILDAPPSAAVPSMTETSTTPASSGWTADFSMPQAAPSTTQPQQTGGLFDVDFSGSRGVVEQSTSSDLFGIDFSRTSSDVGSGLQGLTFPNPAGPTIAEDNSEMSPGERLRQALLSGSGSELNKLYEQNRQPQEVKLSTADRFEALQGNLGNLFSAQQMQPPPSMFSMPSMPSQPSSLPSNSGAWPQQLALPPAPHHVSSVPPLFSQQLALPPSAPSSTGYGFAQQHDPWQIGPPSMFGTGMMPSPAAAPMSFQPQSGPNSTPFPQFSGPPHVGDHLGFMPNSFGNGFQAPNAGFKMPSSPTGNAQRAGGINSPQAVPTSPSKIEEPTSPPKDLQFADLLADFQVKNPINGLGQDGLQILA